MVCRFSLALARGVGQSRRSSVRFPPLDRVPEQARGVGQFTALADGKDEQPLALVARADFRRRKEACRKAVAHADQSCGDFGKTEAEMMATFSRKTKGGSTSPMMRATWGHRWRGSSLPSRRPATENGWHG